MSASETAEGFPDFSRMGVTSRAWSSRPNRTDGAARLIGLAVSPASDPACKALTGVDAFRLRVQDFRVVFSETADTIAILDIGPRGGIYDWERPKCP